VRNGSRDDHDELVMDIETVTMRDGIPAHEQRADPPL